jgi:hypothetical protein
MYGFGEEEQGGPQGQSEQGPKWFREQMAEVSGTLKELRAENERLKENQRQEQVAKTLTAKGYAPQAAGLYTGTPDKLDDWLSANGAALAKTGGEAVEQGQGVQGTPASVVSPESQAAMQQMASAGVDGVAAISGDDQLAARMEAANTPEEFNAIMREAGNVRFR